MKYQSIVFSGLPGAGKSTLVAKLQEIYGWPVLSIGDLWRQKWAKLYPNKEISFEEYWRTTSSEDNRQVNVDFRARAARNYLLGDSRYTIYLKDLPVLLIFLTADLNTRAKRGVGLAKYNGSREEEIKTYFIAARPMKWRPASAFLAMIIAIRPIIIGFKHRDAVPGRGNRRH